MLCGRTGEGLSRSHAGGSSRCLETNTASRFIGSVNAAIARLKNGSMVSGRGNPNKTSWGDSFPGLAVTAVLLKASHTQTHASAHIPVLVGNWVSGHSRGASKIAAAAASWTSPSPRSATPFSFGVFGGVYASVCRARRTGRGTFFPANSPLSSDRSQSTKDGVPWSCTSAINRLNAAAASDFCPS